MNCLGGKKPFSTVTPQRQPLILITHKADPARNTCVAVKIIEHLLCFFPHTKHRSINMLISLSREREERTEGNGSVLGNVGLFTGTFELSQEESTPVVPGLLQETKC